MTLEVIPVEGLPEVGRGQSLGRLIIRALQAMDYGPMHGDVLAVSQKVVSKAEGSVVELGTVVPSPLATTWARMARKDPRHLEVILRETRRPVRVDLRRGIFIMETHGGFTCANAGVDLSNTGRRGLATILPRNPDASADALGRALARAFSPAPGVIVVDTFGRPWRRGLLDVVLGASGVPLLRDERGRRDPSGYSLKATLLAQGDALAAASQLVRGKLERTPIALLRGLPPARGGERGSDLMRSPEEDLFR